MGSPKLKTLFQLDEKEIQLHEQKKNAKKTVKKLQTQLSQEKDRRKRSYEEAVRIDKRLI